MNKPFPAGSSHFSIAEETIGGHSSTQFDFYETAKTDHAFHLLKGGDYQPDLRIQAYHDNRFEGVDGATLVDMLREAEALNEQADIIHYMYITK